MKRKTWFGCGAALILAILAIALRPKPEAKYGFTVGDPGIKSLESLAFGPNNILFAGDSESGAVFAFQLDDAVQEETVSDLTVERIDEKIAAMLGVVPKDIRIRDLAVNPVSQLAYLSVSRQAEGNSHSLLFRLTRAGVLEEVPLKKIAFSKYLLPNPVALDAKSKRGVSLRAQAITDLAYEGSSVYIAGLSNEEFASTFRKVTFPFQQKGKATSLEIYHVAHDASETNAPIRTFLTLELNQKPHILAAYTCTPLVAFPMDQMKPGAHIKGKTLAELGSGNRPLDMVHIRDQGKDYVVIANNRRGTMRIDLGQLEKQNRRESLNQTIDSFHTTGVPYITIPFSGVHHLEKLNEKHLVAVYRDLDSGALNLTSVASRIIAGRFD